MAELRQQQTGVVYPPGLQTYEKYQTIFNRPSPALSRRPFLPQSKVALYNDSFEKAGFTPLPEWREPPESLSALPS